MEYVIDVYELSKYSKKERKIFQELLDIFFTKKLSDNKAIESNSKEFCILNTLLIHNILIQKEDLEIKIKNRRRKDKINKILIHTKQ